jgi:hypothetical protein
MNMSNEIDKIAPALVAIQEGMTVVKDAEGVHNAKYATLGAILLTLRPILKEHDLTVMQSMETNDKVVTCTTRVMHSSGQWIDSVATVTAGGLSPQLFGGAISYVRRYGISAALSVATPDDDDDADKIEKAYTKAEELEAIAVDLRKFQAAIFPRLSKFDADAIQLAFEESGYLSEVEDKDDMVRDLIKQSSSKEKLTTIGKRAKKLHEEANPSSD